MIPHDDGSAGPGTGLRLVLGSASPGRAEVLTRARVPFRVVVSGVDEAAVGAALVDGVDGDPNAVIGLSVAWLRRATAALGQDFTRLWEPSNAQR